MASHSETNPGVMVNIHESTPLLATEQVEGQGQDSQYNVQPTSAHQSTSILALVCTLLMLIDISGFLGMAPQMQIFEDIICQNYYATGNRTSLHDCKTEPVQSELAIIQAYKDTFDQLPGILFGVVYGLLADRVGRRPILLCDAWPGTEWTMGKNRLATSFFYFSAVVLTAEIVATPISGITMAGNPWIPFLASSGVEFLAVVVAIFFAPETLHFGRLKSMDAIHSSLNNNENTTTKEQPLLKTVMVKVSHSLELFKESTNFLLSSLNVSLLLLVFFVATLSRQAMALLLQYATKKYHWSYSRATILVSVRGAVNLVDVLIILPVISRLMLYRMKLNGPTKDLWLSRGMAFLLTIGMLLMFFAPVPAILIAGLVAVALGSPLHLTARSSLTSLILPNQVGVLYTSLAVVQSVGILMAGPLLANTFRWGMKLGNTWLGLPFLAASVMYLLAFLLISGVNLSRRPQIHSLQEDNGRNEEH
ncbi:hypothetical protein UA08_03240 [Talaromyces atroroseus]|uniref:Major facilitator superfamily (MFS) profile domain-containing protein n=1 Tax=Talaromyces atroroseus TaxID=1441469 RepID=A0A225AHP0_TALAT|nr:hypothetical protein UA08_03240 [Talaromyces atroroseus]OKL60951.1 hypothetical protein UA08_03240 [Talaromyces atroroseus]